jgi:hypothetical protein
MQQVQHAGDAARGRRSVVSGSAAASQGDNGSATLAPQPVHANTKRAGTSKGHRWLLHTAACCLSTKSHSRCHGLAVGAGHPRIRGQHLSMCTQHRGIARADRLEIARPLRLDVVPQGPGRQSGCVSLHPRLIQPPPLPDSAQGHWSVKVRRC